MQDNPMGRPLDANEQAVWDDQARRESVPGKYATVEKMRAKFMSGGLAQYLFTFEDRSQVLVDFWATGEFTCAKREGPGDVWGPPARLGEEL